MATKFTRMTHKIAIRLHLVAESCTIRSSRSRRPVRKLLDIHPRIIIEQRRDTASIEKMKMYDMSPFIKETSTGSGAKNRIHVPQVLHVLLRGFKISAQTLNLYVTYIS
jgi:hypothetical protein